MGFAYRKLVAGLTGAAFSAAGFLMGFAVNPALASGSVTVNVERTPGISRRAGGPVELGTIHIAEDRDMPEVMQDGDFLELILPEGTSWNEHTRVMLQKGNGRTLLYDEGDEYTFSGEHYLSITLQGVTNKRDVLTIEPYVELSDAPVGNLYVSVQGDILGPLNGEQVAAGQYVHYDVVAESKGEVDGESGQIMDLSPFTLQESCAGSFQREEEIQILLPEGFAFADGKNLAEVRGLDGSDIFGKPELKKENMIVLPVLKSSGDAVRVQVTLKNVDVPSGFTGKVTAEIHGNVFDDVVVVGEIHPSKKAENSGNTDGLRTAGIFWINSATGVIDGKTENMGVAPYVKENRSYLPVRYVAYALGLDENGIQWDADLKAITLQNADMTVELKIGSRRMTVNGVEVMMDVAPEISFDYTMLPARWVAEAFGGMVEWNPQPPMMTIYFNE